MPMRSIGPIQWTRSKQNCHTERENNYRSACNRAEILQDLLDSDKIDKELEARYHQSLVYPYKFSKEGNPNTGEIQIYVDNDESENPQRKPVLKTPEGILEAKQLCLILSHKDVYTITLEEPERGMHPHMISKLRDWIFKKVKNKTVVVISHHPAILDHSTVDRTHICSKSIVAGKIAHSCLKYPTGKRKYGRVEEMKNILFAERILFVEGFTDKIILEAVIDVLVNNVDMNNYSFRYPEHVGQVENDEMEVFVNTEEFRIYISMFHIIELVSGIGCAAPKTEFCETIHREYGIILDFDWLKNKEVQRSQSGKLIKENYDRNKENISKNKLNVEFDKLCSDNNTLVWMHGALENVINEAIEDKNEHFKRSNKTDLVDKDDRYIADLAVKMLGSSINTKRFVRFLNHLFRRTTSA